MFAFTDIMLYFCRKFNSIKYDIMLVKVYELRDPRDEKKCPRYVGITTRRLETRLYEHVKKAAITKNCYKNNWIKSLLKKGVIPTIHLIEEVEGWEYAGIVEQYWIKEFKKQGYKVTNNTDGGGGALGYKHTDKTKLFLQTFRKGIPLSEEHKEKIRLKNTGKIMSKESLVKLSNARKGIKFTEEHRKKLSISRKNHIMSIEHCNSISKSRMGHVVTEETRNKLHLHTNRKEIIIYYDNGSIEKYISIADCSKKLNICRKCISYNAVNNLYSKKHKCNFRFI